jgi:hypothetical protein
MDGWMDGLDWDCLRFVGSVDLWEEMCRPKKVSSICLEHCIAPRGLRRISEN